MRRLNYTHTPSTKSEEVETNKEKTNEKKKQTISEERKAQQRLWNNKTIKLRSYGVV